MKRNERYEAKVAGLRHYFTGKPCKNGHIAKRFTRCGQCTECSTVCRAAYRNRYPEKVRETKRRARFDNPDSRDRIQRRYAAAHPEQVRAFRHAYRARKKQSSGRFTAEDIRRIFTLQKGRCAYCREKLGKGFQRDHIIPLRRGGTNDARNIQLLCNHGCNQSKNGKHPMDYARSLGRLL